MSQIVKYKTLLIAEFISEHKLISKVQAENTQDLLNVDLQQLQLFQSKYSITTANYHEKIKTKVNIILKMKVVEE